MAEDIGSSLMLVMKQGAGSDAMAVSRGGWKQIIKKGKKRSVYKLLTAATQLFQITHHYPSLLRSFTREKFGDWLLPKVSIPLHHELSYFRLTPAAFSFVVRFLI